MPNRHPFIRIPLVCLSLLLIGALACSLPQPTPEGADTDQLATDVAATLTASATQPSIPPSTPTATETPLPSTPSPTALPPSSTPTHTPPPDGVSLNCDGTFQRVRILDEGLSGKTISVDNWDGSAWINVWNASSGDPNLRQLTEQAGYYEFGGCQKLVIVPMRHSGPHIWLELGIHVWNGSGLSQVYFNEGNYGEWTKIGDVIRFREATTLGGSPLGPCEWTTLEHEWDGATFAQTGSDIEVVPGCMP
jgi:hypothetical protein